MSHTTDNEKPESRADEKGLRSDAAEAKRLAARRRFLLGGATAIPVIVTLSQKQAWAASSQVCQSANLGYGAGFTEKDYIRARTEGIASSLYCRPERS